MNHYLQKVVLSMAMTFLIIITSPLAYSQISPSSGDVIDGFPVTLADSQLFVIQANVGSFSSEERAATISNRLEKIAANSTIKIEDLRLEENGNMTNCIIDNKVVLTLTEEDAAVARKTRPELANEYLNIIKDNLQKYRKERSFDYLIKAAIYTAIATGILLVILIAIGRIFPHIYNLLDSWRDNRILSLRIQNFQLLKSEKVADILIRVAKLIRWVLVLSLLYVYLPLVFSFFPWTQQLGSNLLGYLFGAAELIITAFFNYLPNLFVIAFIVFVTYYIIRFCKLFFSEIQAGDISFPGFYPEWSQPTYKLLTFLILALAAVIAFPYLPGSGSPAFQGISLFLGLLLSLGSTAAIANIVGGIILIYTRAFEVGDRVEISDAVGDIVEKTLLVTRIRTTKNVVITMPNSTVLTSNVINFSAALRHADTPPLILHTTITLGYDVPWRTVHQILIDAALITHHILTEPAPFILQTSLDDFYVSYELNAYTDKPLSMAKIYSELHQNIQDKCNEADIEILSPHYSALRDGNQITIPGNYLPKDYTAPGFRVHPLNPTENVSPDRDTSE